MHFSVVSNHWQFRHGPAFTGYGFYDGMIHWETHAVKKIFVPMLEVDGAPTVENLVVVSQDPKRWGGMVVEEETLYSGTDLSVGRLELQKHNRSTLCIVEPAKLVQHHFVLEEAPDRILIARAGTEESSSILILFGEEGFSVREELTTGRVLITASEKRERSGKNPVTFGIAILNAGEHLSIARYGYTHHFRLYSWDGNSLRCDQDIDYQHQKSRIENMKKVTVEP